LPVSLAAKPLRDSSALPRVSACESNQADQARPIHGGCLHGRGCPLSVSTRPGQFLVVPETDQVHDSSDCFVRQVRLRQSVGVPRQLVLPNCRPLILPVHLL
jgi:hypothetical protein